MRVNPYYNKDTMNFKQFTCDLEKQGFSCEISDEDEYLCVHYLCYIDYVIIALSDYNDWSVIHYQPFKEPKFYHVSTNWSVIKLLRKLLQDAK